MDNKLRVRFYRGVKVPLPSEKKGNAVMLLKKDTGAPWVMVVSSAKLCNDLLHQVREMVTATPSRLYPRHSHLELDLEGVSLDELIAIFEGCGFVVQMDKNPPDWTE